MLPAALLIVVRLASSLWSLAMAMVLLATSASFEFRSCDDTPIITAPPAMAATPIVPTTATVAPPVSGASATATTQMSTPVTIIAAPPAIIARSFDMASLSAWMSAWYWVISAQMPLSELKARIA